MEQIQLLAGSLAGLIFAAASLNMVIKAWRTKDLQSYSLGQMLLNNVGNLLHWLYVLSLPVGPVWFSHAFFTLVSLLMLVWYFSFRPEAQPSQPSPTAAENIRYSFQPSTPVVPFPAIR